MSLTQVSSADPRFVGCRECVDVSQSHMAPPAGKHTC